MAANILQRERRRLRGGRDQTGSSGALGGLPKSPMPFAYPVPGAAPIPFRPFGMGTPDRGFQSAEMAFFKAMCAAQRNGLPRSSLLVGTINGQRRVVPSSIKYLPKFW